MKIFSILLIVILLSNACMGQDFKNITPLHVFLQKNADSTIIFKYETNVADPPVFTIISKKGDTISLYIYKSLYKNKLKIPQAIRDTLYRLNNYSDYIKSYNVGINKFFNAKYIDDKSSRSFWLALLKQNPWQIRDDLMDGQGCPKEDPNHRLIYDGGGISLDLITKDEIKHLYFYAPQFYEKQCPGRTGRMAVIEIEKLFSIYFKE